MITPVRLKTVFKENLRIGILKVTKGVYEQIRPIGSQRPKLRTPPTKNTQEYHSTMTYLSMAKSPQSDLSNVLVSVLKPVPEKFSTIFFPDSFTFVNKLISLNFTQSNIFIASFDIKRLFTMVPLGGALGHMFKLTVQF